jgi:dolichol-phosphate mannosyltransferase
MGMKKKTDFLIIIPAYNEEENIEQLVMKTKQFADVCIVNDNSQDSTAEILCRFRDIHVIHHDKNTHIPGAVLDGMKYAVEQGYKYGITMDAGFSHNPDELSLFINHPDADLVIGSRKKKINTPVYRRLLSLTGNYIYNIALDFPDRLIKKERYYKDISSGYRRYSNRAMKLLLSRKMQSKSLDFLIESTFHIYQFGFSISEVPIIYMFSNSSLKVKGVKDCLEMSKKLMINGRKTYTA